MSPGPVNTLEANIKLPQSVSALPGAVGSWPYQREIADAISDPEIERVTLVKPVRIGFTTLLTEAIASFVANEPSPILRVNVVRSCRLEHGFTPLLEQKKHASRRNFSPSGWGSVTPPAPLAYCFSISVL